MLSMLTILDNLLSNDKLLEFIGKSAFIVLPLSGALFLISRRKSVKMISLGIIIPLGILMAILAFIGFAFAVALP